MTAPRQHQDDPALLRRSLRTVAGGTSPIVQLDGAELVNMASNNYLGLATHPEVIEAGCKAARKYGAGAGASPMLTGRSPLHETLEAAISTWKDTEAAVLFPTGFAANLGTIAALASDGFGVSGAPGAPGVRGERGATIVADARNHGSLVDACRQADSRTRHYHHADTARARHLLRRRASAPKRLLVTDSIFSMDGDLAPLVDLYAVAKECDATLIVDDAHATGVLGVDGAGAMSHVGIDAADIVQTGTLSKALGSQGGFVAGSKKTIDRVINGARTLMLSTSLAPFCVGAALQAVRIAQCDSSLRNTARAHRDRLHTELRAQGWNVLGDPAAPLLAVLVGSADAALQLEAELCAHGVFAPAIRPPTVKQGSSRLRLAPMATHSEAQIDRVIQAFSKCCAQPETLA